MKSKDDLKKYNSQPRRVVSNPSTEDVVIDHIALGGDGLGRLSNGERVFISGAAPGDLIEVRNVTRTGGVARAAIGRILRSGPDRIEPQCPLVGRCGGCDLMHLSRAGQKQVKLGILKDALRRIGGEPLNCDPIGYVQLEVGVAYRSRLRLHVDQNGDLGFLSPRSKNIVTVQDCLVADPCLNLALAHLATVTPKGRQLLRLCDQIELRASGEEPQLLARLFPKPRLQLQACHFEWLLPKNTRIVVVGSLDDDQSIQRYALPGDVTISAPASAFTQVNQGVNALLVQAVVRAASLRSLRSFVDAYAGAGNFTLPLLAAGLTGESIDCVAAGILAARSVARDRGLPFNGFQVGDAKALLESFVLAGRQFELILLDPPRGGSNDVLSQALRLRPQLMLLVACDPVSLARDLKFLSIFGWKNRRIDYLRHVSPDASYGDVGCRRCVRPLARRAVCD